MPFYRFQVDTPLTKLAVLERIRAVSRKAPGFFQSIQESFGGREGGCPPFIGNVGENTFWLYRDIRYRNSFLPRVRGRVVSTSVGTRVFVEMYLHPLVGAFMLLWLGGIGSVAVSFVRRAETLGAVFAAGMFMFGVALTLGCFYPEALKARRLLEECIRAGGARSRSRQPVRRSAVYVRGMRQRSAGRPPADRPYCDRRPSGLYTLLACCFCGDDRWGSGSACAAWHTFTSR